jgi:hypothetical protein
VWSFYLPQLQSGTTLWDGVDVHYSSQRYFADALHAGHLPFWTPYLFAGFPFLADLQVGAWYPLNWPFFLVGITPDSISDELLLHSLVACVGTYALAVRLIGRPLAAVAAALCYGLSGYFAGHSQHVGMFQTASWLPWLVLVLDRLGDQLSLTRVVLFGVLCATVALPGHFQATLYAATGATLWALAEAAIQRAPRRLSRLTVGLLVGGSLGYLLAAVMIVPGLELVGQSVRTRVNASDVNTGYFHPDALLTLVYPNYYGVLTGIYTGPYDISQYYLYAGILLVPLAVRGLRSRRVRRTALLLGLPFLWYALGPAGGLFRLVAQLPGFRNVHGPINGWFLPALGLALLAGAGLPLHRRRLSLVLVGLLSLDLITFNSLLNPLAFARQTSEARYAAPLRAFAAQLAAAQPVERLDGPPLLPVGYLNYQLQARVETTYGYNPLELARFADYMVAAQTNRRLLDGLAVSHELVLGPNRELRLVPNPNPLPRALVARRVTSLPDEPSAIAHLLDLDPAAETIVVGQGPPVQPDPSASVTVTEHGDDSLRLRYHAASPSLLRIAVAWFPGWQASLDDGTRLEVLSVDHALLGVVVPAGDGQLSVRYTPRLFWPAAVASLLGLLACLAVLVVRLRGAVAVRPSRLYRPRRATPHHAGSGGHGHG